MLRVCADSRSMWRFDSQATEKDVGKGVQQRIRSIWDISLQSSSTLIPEVAFDDAFHV